ncbi:hypothetical protein OUZ56_030107 [Daphnia magna]|uniref:Uncharacterized protein n=1 Tax=Daphnia magna TaxID=35525 RepID=A0ABQ9ZQD2_9CRUS|nr:hypothetical protein OUZ56_030107 [Daphnia magna]
MEVMYGSTEVLHYNICRSGLLHRSSSTTYATPGYYTEAPAYYTTTYATPSYYTEAPAYYTTTYATPSYYTDAPNPRSKITNESDLFPYNIVIAERIYTLEH